MGQPAHAKVPQTADAVTLEVPDWAAPGTQLTVTAPSGRQLTVTVPDGAVAGQHLEVDVQVPEMPPKTSVVLDVPEGAAPGTQLIVTAPGCRQVAVTVPEGASVGQQLEVELPAIPHSVEIVVIEVPDGAAPGTQLTVTAPSGRQVTVTMPEGAAVGQQLEVEVPIPGANDAFIKNAAVSAYANTDVMPLAVFANARVPPPHRAGPT